MAYYYVALIFGTLSRYIILYDLWTHKRRG